jgi:hypothetical protein
MNRFMHAVRIALAVVPTALVSPHSANTASEWKNRGLELMDQGRIKDAVAAFRETRALDPNCLEREIRDGALDF